MEERKRTGPEQFVYHVLEKHDLYRHTAGSEKAIEEIAALITATSTLKAALRTVLGHSRCYCENCRDISAKYFWPKPGEE